MNKCFNPTTTEKCGRKSAAKFFFQHKIAYFGHMKKHDNLDRAIFQGIIEGRRGRGQQEEVGVKTSQIVKTQLSPIGLHTAQKSCLRQKGLTSICHLDNNYNLRLDLPVQMRPSPSNPALHAQENDPSEFRHWAFASQGSLAHSLSSEKNILPSNYLKAFSYPNIN